MKQVKLSPLVRALAFQLLLVFACITVMQFLTTSGSFTKYEIRKSLPNRDAGVQALLEEREMDEAYQTVPILEVSLFLLQDLKLRFNAKSLGRKALIRQEETTRSALFLQLRVLRL